MNDLPRTCSAGVPYQLPSLTSASSFPSLQICLQFMASPLAARAAASRLLWRRGEERPRRDVAESLVEELAKHLLLHACETYAGRAVARKSAEGKERLGLRREQRLVRVQVELEHSGFPIRRDGGEDPSADAEGGAVEVRLFADLRQRQRQRAELLGGDHGGAGGKIKTATPRIGTKPARAPSLP